MKGTILTDMNTDNKGFLMSDFAGKGFLLIDFAGKGFLLIDFAG